MVEGVRGVVAVGGGCGTRGDVRGRGAARAQHAAAPAPTPTLLPTLSSNLFSVGLLGSEEQKQELLPPMAALKTVGAWALTEPSNGSDAAALQTTARKVDGGWVLNGRKRWIGNATWCDVVVVWARNTGTGQVNAFVVRKGTPGFVTSKIENKIALRCVQNADIAMTDVFVADTARLPGVNTFQVSVVWGCGRGGAGGAERGLGGRGLGGRGGGWGAQGGDWGARAGGLVGRGWGWGGGARTGGPGRDRRAGLDGRPGWDGGWPPPSTQFARTPHPTLLHPIPCCRRTPTRCWPSHASWWRGSPWASPTACTTCACATSRSGPSLGPPWPHSRHGGVCGVGGGGW